MKKLRINPAVFVILQRLFVVTVLSFSAQACDAFSQKQSGKFWVGTWATSQQLVEPQNMPPAPGLNKNTLRQVVRVSLGGEQLRVQFSNRFSTSSVSLQSVHIAAHKGAGVIDSASDKALTFNGQTSVTLAPGEIIYSDAISFHLNALSELAVSIYFGDTSLDVTGHPGSRTTSYIAAGNQVSAQELSMAANTDHWYVMSGIDVKAKSPSAAVVVLGDSITDGRGSGTNRQNRWTDELINKLHANPQTAHIAMLNHGVGGNCVLKACLGPAALDRFDRDVLKQPGAKWLIIFEGINDIGQIKDNADAQRVSTGLIEAFKTMIDSAHANGIKVYGATLMPFAGSFYDNPDHEWARQQVNSWIRTSGRFDAIMDFESILNDPANIGHLKPEADTGDHLHPNEIGYRMVADAIDINLFR